MSLFLLANIALIPMSVSSFHQFVLPSFSSFAYPDGSILPLFYIQATSQVSILFNLSACRFPSSTMLCPSHRRFIILYISLSQLFFIYCTVPTNFSISFLLTFSTLDICTSFNYLYARLLFCSPSSKYPSYPLRSIRVLFTKLGHN